jgi:hypothetical protein
MQLSVDRAVALTSGTELFQEALDVARARAPSTLWDQLGPVQLSQDAATTEQSIRQLIAQHPPPEDLSAIWFGLYEIGNHPSETESVVALSGGPTYPSDNWLFEQTWYPPGYLATPGLQPLASLASAYGDDLFHLVTYSLTFAYAVGLVSEVLQRSSGPVLFGDHDRLGVAVGFHDGDILELGELRADGLDTTSARI